ncbi:hypothetical protein VTL71DRAFT_4814 [Oculimacula yallundae]|uniref:DUF6594 domain-containing protein n=1 Tax=Oculimacula yallundae TaxID=86028 RepID=A0ABR4C315_9HELO
MDITIDQAQLVESEVFGKPCKSTTATSTEPKNFRPKVLIEEVSLEAHNDIEMQTDMSHPTRNISCAQSGRGTSSSSRLRAHSGGNANEGCQIDKTPEGYPRVAAFLTSDHHLMLYRGFNYLQSRLLLHKQDELRELEDSMDIMDQVDESDHADRLMSREEDDKQDGKRKALFDLAESTFNEYVATLLLNAREISNFHSPRARSYKAVKDYFDVTKPNRKHECHIYHKEDILCLQKGRLDSWLDARIEKFLSKHNWRLLRFVLSTTDQIKKSDPGQIGVEVFSRARVNRLKLTIIFTSILAQFAGPVYLLWYLARKPQNNSTTAISVGILLTFTCTFSVVLSEFLSAQRHELIAAAAAYCAVLVVFIGNAKN